MRRRNTRTANKQRIKTHIILRNLIRLTIDKVGRDDNENTIPLLIILNVDNRDSRRQVNQRVMAYEDLNFLSIMLTVVRANSKRVAIIIELRGKDIDFVAPDNGLAVHSLDPLIVKLALRLRLDILRLLHIINYVSLNTIRLMNRSSSLIFENFTLEIITALTKLIQIIKRNRLSNILITQRASFNLAIRNHEMFSSSMLTDNCAIGNLRVERNGNGVLAIGDSGDEENSIDLVNSDLVDNGMSLSTVLKKRNRTVKDNIIRNMLMNIMTLRIQRDASRLRQCNVAGIMVNSVIMSNAMTAVDDMLIKIFLSLLLGKKNINLQNGISVTRSLRSRLNMND